MNVTPSYSDRGMGTIIQHASPGVIAREPYQALVVLNHQTGEEVPSWWRYLVVVPVRFYLITNRHDPSAVAYLRVQAPIHDVRAQRILPLLVECQVRVEPGYELRMAQAFHGDHDFTHVMHGYVRQWVNEYAHLYGVEAVVRGFEQHRDAMHAHLTSQARRIGLEIAVRAGREDEHQPQAGIGVGPGSVHVQLADCPDPQILHLRIDLTATPDRMRAAMAINQGREHLQAALRDAAVRWMVQVPLCDFAERITAVANAPLWRHLDTVAAPFGLRVSVLMLQSQLDESATAVVRGLEPLRREPHEFKVEVRSQEGLTVRFNGAFNVIGLTAGGYRLFSRRSPRVETVVRELTAHAQTELGTMSHGTLCHTPSHRLRELLDARVRGHLRADFGLEVEVRRIERELTQGEQDDVKTFQEVKQFEANQLRAALQAQQKRIFDELDGLDKLRARLVQERNEAILGGLGEATVADADRKIRQVDERIEALKSEVARNLLHNRSAPAVSAVAGGMGRAAMRMLSSPLVAPGGLETTDSGKGGSV